MIVICRCQKKVVIHLCHSAALPRDHMAKGRGQKTSKQPCPSKRCRRTLRVCSGDCTTFGGVQSLGSSTSPSYVFRVPFLFLRVCIVRVKTRSPILAGNDPSSRVSCLHCSTTLLCIILTVFCLFCFVFFWKHFTSASPLCSNSVCTPG